MTCCGVLVTPFQTLKHHCPTGPWKLRPLGSGSGSSRGLDMRVLKAVPGQPRAEWLSTGTGTVPHVPLAAPLYLHLSLCQGVSKHPPPSHSCRGRAQAAVWLQARGLRAAVLVAASSEPLKAPTFPSPALTFCADTPPPLAGDRCVPRRPSPLAAPVPCEANVAETSPGRDLARPSWPTGSTQKTMGLCGGGPGREEALAFRVL